MRRMDGKTLKYTRLPGEQAGLQAEEEPSRKAGRRFPRDQQDSEEGRPARLRPRLSRPKPQEWVRERSGLQYQVQSQAGASVC